MDDILPGVLTNCSLVSEQDVLLRLRMNPRPDQVECVPRIRKKGEQAAATFIYAEREGRRWSLAVAVEAVTDPSPQEQTDEEVVWVQCLTEGSNLQELLGGTRLLPIRVKKE